jgi:exonuclease III
MGCEHIKLLSWNIRHGGWTAAPLAPAIAAHDPDLIVLSEYRVERSASLIEQLGSLGWPHLAESGVTGISNGVAIVSRAY